MYTYNHFGLRGKKRLCSILSNIQILTRSANGNDAAALFNTTVSNLLGMVITPLLLLIFLGRSGNSVSTLQTVLISLLFTVLVPLLIGQAIALVSTDVFNCC
jgi:sodium/bile acid cotransporter 7